MSDYTESLKAFKRIISFENVSDEARTVFIERRDFRPTENDLEVLQELTVGLWLKKWEKEEPGKALYVKEIENEHNSRSPIREGRLTNHGDQIYRKYSLERDLFLVRNMELFLTGLNKEVPREIISFLQELRPASPHKEINMGK